MRLLKFEEETIINFNAGEDDVLLYTRDSADIRKLYGRVDAYPNVCRQDGQEKSLQNIFRGFDFSKHSGVI